MKRSELTAENLPSSAQLEAELDRVRYRRSFGSALRGTVYTLVTVAALAVLVAVLFLPVLRIYGESMAPTLSEGQLVHYVPHRTVHQTYGNRTL